MSDKILIPPTLSTLVTSLCADYSRRAIVLTSDSAPFNVLMEYRFLNYRILNAAKEIAGERDALNFVEDIGTGIGYSFASVYLSESVYKQRKQQVREHIARRLSLI